MMTVKALSQLPSKRGNTVLEGALVLGILAIGISGGIFVSSGQYAKAYIKQQEEYLDQMADALRQYFEQYGQWPQSLELISEIFSINEDIVYENHEHYVLIRMNNHSRMVTKPLLK